MASAMGDQQDGKMNPPAARAHSLPNIVPAKRVYMYRNGDVYFSGKNVLVNPRYTRTWNAFLEQLNQGFNTGLGAVQRIHTPLHGHVVDDFSQLENGSAYVVAGPERFRRMNYDEIRTRNQSPPKSRKMALQREIIEAKPVVHSKIQAETKVKLFTQPKSLWFYRNGDEFSKPLLMLLKSREMQSWDQLLRSVSDKIVLANNSAIRKIFKLNGEEIVHVDQLENNQFYVVAGNEKFMSVTYGHLPPNMLLITPRDKPFGHVKYLSNLPTPPKQGSFAETSEKSKAYYEALRSTRKHQQRQKKPLPAVDYDQDNSGRFRASRPHEETRGARPINDEEQQQQQQPQRSPSPRTVQQESQDEHESESANAQDKQAADGDADEQPQQQNDEEQQQQQQQEGEGADDKQERQKTATKRAKDNEDESESQQQADAKDEQQEQQEQQQEQHADDDQQGDEGDAQQKDSEENEK